jgi:GntR family transcriptional regulator, rspAB operon transcriptional repressor
VNISEQLPKESAREYAIRILKKNIISLDLPPGSMVSENEISLQLGLSRTPVREALIELGKVSIVEIFPQKGSWIKLIDYNLVEEAYFLRMVLENAVVKILCESEMDLNLSALEENLKLQEFYMDQQNTEKLLELDNSFHRELFSRANKQLCYQWLIDGMTIHFDRVRILSLHTVKDIKIVSDHKAILLAIKDRNASESVEQMIMHLSRYKIDEKEIRKKYPEYLVPIKE